MAARATAFLRRERELFLADLIVAETVYVLESFYETPRTQIAEIVRSLVAMRSVVVVDRDVLLRAVEVYETDRLDFAEAYLVASAESTGIGSSPRSTAPSTASGPSNGSSRPAGDAVGATGPAKHETSMRTLPIFRRLRWLEGTSLIRLPTRPVFRDLGEAGRPCGAPVVPEVSDRRRQLTRMCRVPMVGKGGVEPAVT